MNQCPNRNITESGSLRCRQMPQDFLPGPRTLYYPCHACEVLWIDGPPTTPEIPEKAAALGQYHPESPLVADAGGRGIICNSCPQWKQSRCLMICACRAKEPANPNAETGPNCPMGKWRRPLTSRGIGSPETPEKTTD